MDFYGFANDAGMLHQLQIDIIDADPDQPRREFDPEAIRSLAQSMENTMLLEPIVVYRVGDRYRVLVGERRLQAARLNEWAVIDARVVDKPDQPLIVQLAENIQRQNLLPWEILLSVEKLMDDGLSVHDIADASGMSKSQLRRYQRVSRHDDMRAELLGGATLREVIEKYASKSDDATDCTPPEAAVDPAPEPPPPTDAAPDAIDESTHENDPDATGGGPTPKSESTAAVGGTEHPNVGDFDAKDPEDLTGPPTAPAPPAPNRHGLPNEILTALSVVELAVERLPAEQLALLRNRLMVVMATMHEMDL